MENRKRAPSLAAPDPGRRWSEADAMSLLDEWATSGLSLGTFAQQRGIHPQRLWWWKKRLGISPARECAASASFIPVTVCPTASEPVAASVEIGGAIRVQVRALDETSAGWIAALVRSLGGAS